MGKKRAVAYRFLAGEEGQDLIEYALLTAFIGLAGAAMWPLVRDALQISYATWDSSNQGLWEPAAPAGS